MRQYGGVYRLVKGHGQIVFANARVPVWRVRAQDNMDSYRFAKYGTLASIFVSYPISWLISTVILFFMYISTKRKLINSAPAQQAEAAE